MRNNLDAATEALSVLINARKADFQMLTAKGIIELKRGESEKAINALCDIYKRWVPNSKILKTNIWSSELAKLTANAFLAQRISSINSISAICEATGADVREVSRAIGTDNRIGSKFLDSGPGFGGSCFKKDILNLVYLAEYFGLPEVGEFWEGVVKLNFWHQDRISTLIIRKLFGTLSGKKIAILGFAFKANTNDTRESAAIQICKNLIEEGAVLAIHDPKVEEFQIERDLNSSSDEDKRNWKKFKNIDDTLLNSDAAVILTEWQIYGEIDWINASKIMMEIRKEVRSKSSCQVLWASPRMSYDYLTSIEVGCHIITMQGQQIKKLKLFGKKLEDYSLETVKQFYNDAHSSGFKI